MCLNVYDMFHILLSCDSQGSMECIYVCMYVCMYVCTMYSKVIKFGGTRLNNGTHRRCQNSVADFNRGYRYFLMCSEQEK